MIKSFNILSLDVWGNSQDGFEINDVRTISSLDIDLNDSDNAIKTQVFKHLENEGFLTFFAPYNVENASLESEIEFLDDTFAEITDKKDGMPLYQLRSE